MNWLRRLLRLKPTGFHEMLLLPLDGSGNPWCGVNPVVARKRRCRNGRVEAYAEFPLPPYRAKYPERLRLSIGMHTFEYKQVTRAEVSQAQFPFHISVEFSVPMRVERDQ